MVHSVISNPLTDPVAKRRTLFLVLSLSVCYPLSKVSGAEDES